MHAEFFLAEACATLAQLDRLEIERMAEALAKVEGRIYTVGLGGSLANCTHMAADLRKLCNLDAVAPDNIAELTAWANDLNWGCLFDGYLHNMTGDDALFVLSVGGGTDTVSKPLKEAIIHTKLHMAQVFGIVGPNGGFTAERGDHVIRIPVSNAKHVTPHTEAFQAVIWHCLVSHPALQRNATKW